MTRPSTHRAQCHLPIAHNLLILTSIHPFTVHSSICIYPSVHMICSPSLLPSVHRSVHSSTHPSLALSIHLPICSLFPIRPPICPLSITPEHAELLGHLSQPNSPRLSNNLLSIPPVLIFRIIPLSIYAVCLPGHPSIHYPPIRHLLVPPLVQTFVHCPPLTTHLLVIPVFARLFIYVSADVCTHPSTQLPFHPSIISYPPTTHPTTQPAACLPFWFFLHFPYTHPTPTKQLFPEEMRMAFLISPIRLLVPLFVTPYLDF